MQPEPVQYYLKLDEHGLSAIDFIRERSSLNTNINLWRIEDHNDQFVVFTKSRQWINDVLPSNMTPEHELNTRYESFEEAFKHWNNKP